MWRPWNPADEERVVALCLALYTEDPSIVPVGEAKVRRTLALFRARPDRGLVAVLEVDGSTAGYALLVPWWSNELGGEVCLVDELYVAPEARGRGLATELLRTLAGGTGPFPNRFVALQLEVTPGNHRARALYERLGFEPMRNLSMRRRLLPDPGDAC
jgi:ribosomal protein S18 acetylase RimI-like enzyme